MEEYKLKYLSNFLGTFQVPLKKLIEHVNHEVKSVCGCYEDMYVKNVKVASEVILMDAIFIVELFLKNYFVKLREKGDMVFDNSSVSNEILHDLLLFENQLPFRFLSELYKEFVGNKVGNIVLDDDPVLCSPTFDELVYVYFRRVGNAGNLRSIDFQRARHFVEFLSMLHMPDEEKRHKKISGEELQFSKCPTATELIAVGVKFKKGTASCFMDITFMDGVLTIPPLTVNGFTETFFRNLIAFEQSGYYFKYTTSFAIFLDNLMKTGKDVDILINHGIIKNELAGSEQVAAIFNTLNQEFLGDPKEFYFVEECRLLNEYSGHLSHMIKETITWSAIELWNRYLKNPWLFGSLFAAVVILALTATQSGYAIMTFNRGH